MSFTYTGDLSNPIDYIRFTIGDKTDEGHVFEDEEIQFFISKYPSPISERNLKKVSVTLLKNILREILLTPSRERSGTFEVYRSDANSLQLFIKVLEEEIEESMGFASPSFGGVYKAETVSNRHNPEYTPTRFYHGRIYKYDERYFYESPLIR